MKKMKPICIRLLNVIIKDYMSQLLEFPMEDRGRHAKKIKIYDTYTYCKTYNTKWGCARLSCKHPHVCRYCLNAHSDNGFCESTNLNELKRQLRDAKDDYLKLKHLEKKLSESNKGNLSKDLRNLAWAKSIIENSSTMERQIAHLSKGCRCHPEQMIIVFGFIQCQCEYSYQ